VHLAGDTDGHRFRRQGMQLADNLADRRQQARHILLVHLGGTPVNVGLMHKGTDLDGCP
jgi:hypothetical protein